MSYYTLLKNWTFIHAPIFIDTFSVKVADALRSSFSHCKHTIYITKDISELSSTWSRFPGLYTSSVEAAQHYAKFLKSLQMTHEQLSVDTTFAFPRGNISAETVVCGIAPGWTSLKYHESFWLLGPASKTLHLATSDYATYYTNICKTSFVTNKYTDESAVKWIDLFQNELEVLQPKRIIFLGKYELYAKVTLPSSVECIQVYHPSYVNYRQLHDEWSESVKYHFANHEQFMATTSRASYLDSDTSCFFHSEAKRLYLAQSLNGF